MLRLIDWNVNTLITITVGVRGDIHEYSMKPLKCLKTPTKSITKALEYIHQIVITYPYFYSIKQERTRGQTTHNIPILRRSAQPI